ncbi:hypothetical protein RUM44_013566 [Polyplax serrata]|uniref:RING-type E3 ubiquitin transferase n=1 Tax=Polyplax serrata TaxID=468196 RepID=A0ABR1BEI7_POLSC
MKASRKLSKIKDAQFYKVGDKVEAIKGDSGAWFSADIIDIFPNSQCECEDECKCTYKLLFESTENEEVMVADKKLHEIRQVSYLSIDWDKLKVGMKVVVNYNIDKPKQWGLWYDYFIEDIHKRNDVYYLDGILLVGQDGCLNKLHVRLDSDNVSDVLEIRPHATLKEKEAEGYETGVKPEYCKKCRNKPKVKCKKCCCCKCGTKKDFELTVQCDECDDWYHIYCLSPPLQKLPNDEDWYCPKCNNETHRAKAEMKLKLKKQRQGEKLKKTPTKLPQPEEKTSKKKISLKRKLKSDPMENIEEFQEITKEIPKDSKIWNEVERHFSGYEILRVVAEVVKKKNTEEVIDSDVEEYIKQDHVNGHLWEEAKQSASKGKQFFLETVKRIFTCPICCDLLNDPITLSCKHSFCIDCFFRSLSVNVYNCSLCRVHVIHTQHYVVNENLKKALALLFNRKISKKLNE